MRFLLVDRVLRYEPEGLIEAVKNIALESPYFEQHFPEMPVFPGVLVIEAMAQTGGYLLSRHAEASEGRKLFAMMTGVNSRFLRQALPGDQLRMTARLLRLDAHLAKVSAEARIEGEVAARAELSYALKDDDGDPRHAALRRQGAMLRRVLERSPQASEGGA